VLDVPRVVLEQFRNDNVLRMFKTKISDVRAVSMRSGSGAEDSEKLVAVVEAVFDMAPDRDERVDRLDHR
jgi:hypothetical protein